MSRWRACKRAVQRSIFLTSSTTSAWRSCSRKRDAPQSDHRMRLAVGGGDGELAHSRFERAACRRDNQIARQERAVGRGAQHELYIGPVGRSPIQRRQDAGERSGKIGDAVRNDRQAERRKARGIAIGVEDEPVALRR